MFRLHLMGTKAMAATFQSAPSGSRQNASGHFVMEDGKLSQRGRAAEAGKAISSFGAGNLDPDSVSGGRPTVVLMCYCNPCLTHLHLRPFVC